MKFDTVIIGGGLSGLVCGIRLSQQGQRCVIISSGQSALHFSSGSLDLLNTLPDKSEVVSLVLAIKDLIKQAPKHPYSKIGEYKFQELAQQAKMFFEEVGISLKGNSENNHFRITPLGGLKPTWLTSADFAISETQTELPWKKVSILNVDGFIDFYPRFIADEFEKVGTRCEIHSFSLPDLDTLRRNPSELRATNIARVLDKEHNKRALIDILKEKAVGNEAIILPAIIGLESQNTIRDLQQAVDTPILLTPTLPPSIIGMRMQQQLRKTFQRLGGVYMLGDCIQKAEVVNNKVSKLYSYNHGSIPFVGSNIVLATGSYFSQGIIATQDKVYEPIFNLDMDYSVNRLEWYNSNMFEAQSYQSFGVKTNNTFNGLYGGVAIDNLYVSGAILEGFNPIKEGCGAGVSILSALQIADTILSK
ncbi:MAG: glycerol-3-phosphate dehydrogenase subunit GlpB [Dysgonomonas sp.]|nr:glycerol-3-phosphate dehydrogenase subunit GlpB [Dysgonomonas sp.]